MRRLLLGLVTTATLFTACGDDQVSADADASQQASDDQEIHSPLEEFLGLDWRSGDPLNPAETAAMDRKAQELAAACMEDKGFEYLPVVAGGSEGPLSLDVDSREWAEKYGFGISTLRFSQESVGPDLVGLDESMTAPEVGGPDDPNLAYVDSLSESEKGAYQTALYGGEQGIPTDAPEDEMAEAGGKAEASGCLVEAYADRAGSLGPNTGAFFGEFAADLGALQMQIETDPQVVSYMAEVSSCVSEKGKEYLAAPELGQYFENKVSLLDPEGNLTDEEKALVGEVQAEEIDMAVVYWDCGGADPQVAAALADVRAEHEQEFLDQNAERLAKFRDPTTD